MAFVSLASRCPPHRQIDRQTDGRTDGWTDGGTFLQRQYRVIHYDGQAPILTPLICRLDDRIAPLSSADLYTAQRRVVFAVTMAIETCFIDVGWWVVGGD